MQLLMTSTFVSNVLEGFEFSSRKCYYPMCQLEVGSERFGLSVEGSSKGFCVPAIKNNLKNVLFDALVVFMFISIFANNGDN